MKTRMFHAMIAVAALTPSLQKQLRYEAAATGITVGSVEGGELKAWAHPHWSQDVYDIAERFGVHLTFADVVELDA